MKLQHLGVYKWLISKLVLWETRFMQIVDITGNIKSSFLPSYLPSFGCREIDSDAFNRWRFSKLILTHFIAETHCIPQKEFTAIWLQPTHERTE